MKKYFLYLPLIFLLPGCVAKRLLTQSQLEASNLKSDSARLANEIAGLQTNMTDLNKRIANLSNQNFQLGQQSASQQSQLTGLKTKELKLYFRLNLMKCKSCLKCNWLI